MSYNQKLITIITCLLTIKKIMKKMTTMNLLATNGWKSMLLKGHEEYN